MKNNPPAQCTFDIQQFVPHLTIEVPDLSVLHGLLWHDVVPPEALVLRLGEDGMRREFGPFVADDQAGRASPLDESCELPSRPVAGNRSVRDRGEILVGDIVDDVEGPEPPAIGHLVMDEIESTAGVRPRFH